jgi:hypothetical protein
VEETRRGGHRRTGAPLWRMSSGQALIFMAAVVIAVALALVA